MKPPADLPPVPAPPLLAAPARRTLLTAAIALPGGLLAPLLGGCAGAAPEPRRLRLPELPPERPLGQPLERPPEPAAPPRPPPAGLPWQLMAPLDLPAWLDDDRVWWPDGPTGLRALAGHRWAEPLRDALPRALQQDLTDALGGTGQVWRAPLPPGLRIGRQLRVQILVLEADARAGELRLQAPWSLAPPDGSAPPQAGHARLTQPLAAPTPDALAQALRQALRRLAGQIVAEAR